MKKITVLLLVAAALKFSNSLAQFPNALDNLRNVMPPSPNSASFAQYGNWPVSLYTGVPNISVPVTTLKGRTISVPVSLSYHASGNHVGDIASWAGLGWTLNAGGVISRSIRGLNDEAGFFGYNSYYANPNDFSSAAPVNITSTREVSTAKNLTDSEQDIYNFSALGKSYRLLILADGSVKTIPHSNIKFTGSPFIGGNPNADWTVIMEDGTTLAFGGSGCTETTANPGFTSSDGNGISYTSSWYLKSIASATGEVITFTYANATIEQDSYFSQSDYIKYQTGSNGMSCTPITHSSAISSHSSIQTVYSLYLKSINSDLERIDFLTTPNRQDLYGGLALSEIRLFSKVTNSYREKYLLNTSYSQAVSGNELLVGTTNTSYFYKRLRLNSFQKIDVIDTTRQPQTWSFIYNPQNLPSRRSFAQDHWGYFNGATNNTSLLPREYFVLPNNSFVNTWRGVTGFMPNSHDLGGVRDGNGTYMQAEILTQVNYPTGGYSQFTYEPNNVPVSQETFTDTNLSLQLNLTYTSGPTGNTQSGSFTITTPGYVGINLSSQISANILRDQPGAKVSCILYDANNNSVGSTALDGIYWFNILNAGTYTATISVNTVASNLSLGDYVTGDATVTYSKSNGVQSFNKLTGGLRVTSIIDYDGLTGAYDPKYYQYANPLVINTVDPVNDYLTSQASSTYSVTTDAGGNFTTTICYFNTVTRNSSTKFASGSIQGGTTGYGQVTTLNGLSGANGYTVSIFNSEPDYSFGGQHVFPYPSSDSKDHRRGLLLTQKDYNAAQVLLKQVDNTYSFIPIAKVIYFKAGYNEVVAQQLCSDIYFNCGILQGWEQTSSEQVVHLSSILTSYDKNGQNPVVTKTRNYYENPNNTQPTKIVSYNSLGDSITTYARTSLELNDINALTPLPTAVYNTVAAMASQNMVSEIVQNARYNNNKLEVIETTNYAKWGASNIILPQSEILQEGTNAPYTVVTVNNYDSFGNPLQLTPVDGVTKSYIWDYKSSHPIAEIKGAGNSAFAYTSFEADGAGNWTISSATRDASTAFTGKASYPLSSNSVSISALSTSQTYVISLWAKAGSTVNINGSVVSSILTRKGWNYYQNVVSNVSSILITGAGNIDEVRLYPSGALMTTYSFGDFGPTSITGPANETSFYEYDGVGRLAVIRDDNNKVLKTYRYNYKTN